MDFGFNDEQQEIKSTAREFLASRFKPEKVRELAEAGSYDDDLWGEICELGWPGIAIDEEHGGQGLGIVELAILCEEIGYACAPVPFLSNAIGGLILAGAGSDEQRERWLGGHRLGRGPRRRRRDGPASRRSCSTPRAPPCFCSTTATAPSSSRPATRRSSRST